MKGSITIVLFFFIGTILGVYKFVPTELLVHDYTIYILYFLMFLVGISIGSDKHALKTIFRQSWKVVLVPLATIIGTLAGCVAISPLLKNITLNECLAVGSGFGYYSLSSIFISQYKGIEMGTVALTSNIMREIITLLLTPLLVARWGKLAAISAAGATSMDTTLPIITKYTGKEFVPIAVFHGVVVDFSVPFLVTFFATL
jgi:uncharacterized membrane protein YbjE (DUF340 family)